MLIRHPLQDLDMYHTSLPFLNVLCRQNHCKNTPHHCHSVFHSSTQTIPFSKFCKRLSSVLFLLWFIFGLQVSDVYWKIFKQCSAFHMRIDQTHGEIVERATRKQFTTERLRRRRGHFRKLALSTDKFILNVISRR